MKTQGSRTVRTGWHLRLAAWGLGAAILGLVCTAPAHAAVMGYWDFNAGSGSTLPDLSVNGYNGTISGATWTAANGGHSGIVGDYALNFSGGAYAQIADTAGLHIGGLDGGANKNFTISMWVQDNGGTDYGEAFCYGTGSTRNMFWQTQGNRGASYLWSDSNGNIKKTWAGLGNGNWHHIAITGDGTNFRFYKDGALVNGPVGGAGTITAWGNLRLGLSTTGIQAWNGRLDDLLILDTTADLATVGQIMNNTYAPMLNYWTGTSANWSNGFGLGAGASLAAGQARNTAIFDTNLQTASNNDIAANTQFKGITFKPGAGAFTLSGNAVNLVNDVTNNSANLQTISTPLVLDGSRNTMFNTVTGDIAVTQAITQASGQTNGLVKGGSGTLTLSGASDYTGPTNINAGKLLLNAGSLGATSVTVTGSSSVLAGVGSVGGAVTAQSGGHLAPGADAATPGTLTLNSGLTLNAANLDMKFGDLTPGNRDLIAITGDLTLTGTSHLSLSQLTGFGYGDYSFLHYSGSLLGDGTISAPAGDTAYGYKILTSTPNELLLHVYLPPSAKIWSGSVNGAWDINSTMNWKSGFTPAVYRETLLDGNDPVLFTDAATGTTDITLDTAVSPGGMTFANNSKVYSISGSGSIGGAYGLTVSGSGGVTLNTANTFTGDTIVSGGTLTLGHGEALAGSTLDSTAGGMLSFGSLTAATFGGLKNSGSAQDIVLQNDSSAAVSLSVGGNNQDTVYDGVLSGTGSITKIGNGMLTLNSDPSYTGSTDVDTGALVVPNLPSTSAINVNGGTLSVQSYNAAAPLTVSAGGTANISATNLNLAAIVNAGNVNFTGSNGTTTLAGLSGGGTTAFSGPAVAITTLGDGALELATGSMLTVQEGTQNSGSISGTASLTKTGSGLLTLNGTSSYTGGTTVEGGTLSLATIPSAGSLRVNNGAALQYSGTATVDATTRWQDGSGGDAYIGVTDPAGNLRITHAFQTIHKTGAGTLTLENALSQDGGMVSVDEGTLVLAGKSLNYNWYANVAGISDVKPGATVTFGKYPGDNQFHDGQVYYNSTFHMSGGTFDVNGTPYSGIVPAINGSGTITNNAPGTTSSAPMHLNGDQEFSGNIVDGAGVVGVSQQGGGGTWTLSGNNTYSGATSVSNGTMKAGSGTAFSPNSRYTVNSTLDLGGYSNQIAALTGGGTVKNSSGPEAVLTVSNSGADTIFSGVLRDGTIPEGRGKLGLTKDGTANLTLTGVNTYTLDTAVTGGTLTLQGTGSINNSPRVAVASGATLNVTAVTGGYQLQSIQTLSGGGTVLGGVTVLDNATVAPGTLSATGMLTFANGLDMSAAGSGANLAWRLGSLSTSSDFDALALSGGNLALGGSSRIALDFSLLDSALRPDAGSVDSFWTTDKAWKIIGLGVGATNTGDTNFLNIVNGAFSAGEFSTYVGTDADVGSIFLKYTSVPTGPNQWKDLSSGNWTEASNWTNGVAPNAPDAVANLLTKPTTPATVTVDAPVIVGTINLDSATNGYTVGGSSEITLQVAAGSAAINVANGSHTISAPITLASSAVVTVTNSGDTLALSNAIGGTGTSLTKNGDGTLTLGTSGGPANTYTEGTTVNAGALVLANADALPLNRDVTIATGASVREDGNLSNAVQVGGLSISGTGKFDLSGGKLVVDGSVTSEAAVRAYLVAGRHGGNWAGAGITSSWANANSVKYAVGYMKNSDLGSELAYTVGADPGAPATWFGRSATMDSVFVRLTYAGDADLSGDVTTDDFDKWKYSYAESLSATWYHGDFDYSGNIDTDDFDLWKYAYSFSYPALDAPSSAAVPEPGTLALLALGCAGLWLAGLARRRRMK